MALKIRSVVKRAGNTVPYNVKKIVKAISGANKDVGSKLSKDEVNEIALQVDINLKDKNTIHVEEIQDEVEQVLMDNKFFDVAKAYILYRQKHAERRRAATHLMESYNDLLFADAKDMDLKRDNANINTDAPMGIMLKLGTEGAKTWADNFGIPEEFSKPDIENYIHIHKLDCGFVW